MTGEWDINRLHKGSLGKVLDVSQKTFVVGVLFHTWPRGSRWKLGGYLYSNQGLLGVPCVEE